jgi:small subunit ribosomal protein S8
MSMNDPISDLLTRIRNGQTARKVSVSLPASRVKAAIAKVLEAEGYIGGFRTEDLEGKPTLTIDLKYYQDRPVIERIERVSRPGLRVYSSAADLPKVQGGLGIAIVSTSDGVMTDRQARADGHGGEVLCFVS